MSTAFKEIGAPPTAKATLTADQAVVGPHIPAQQQILLYSAEQWEIFIQEWVHYCLKKKYVKVQRASGAGDRGIDVAGFADAEMLQGVWDNYQCKHYDHALYPGDAWPEIGKILWYSFNGEYKAPRRYFFVAPRGAGTTLAGYLADSAKLKNSLSRAGIRIAARRSRTRGRSPSKASSCNTCKTSTSQSSRQRRR